MTIFEVLELPFNHDLGFPQKSFVNIGGLIFIFRYKRNVIDDSVIVQIKDSVTQDILFHGKLVEMYDIPVVGPTYGRAIMYLRPISLDRSNMQIQALVPGLNPDREEEYVD